MTTSVANWADELVACIHFLHGRGWAPATSSNYSFRLPGASEIHISVSGKDKGAFSTADLMRVDLKGHTLAPDRRPSAETLLHTLIYELSPGSTCVLHTHTVYNTVLSALFAPAGQVRLQGFEVLKGLAGIRTHEHSVDLPIFGNSQDMPALAETIRAHWQDHPDLRAFLLAGHGMYTWGASIAEAKRHVEVIEFLLEVVYKMHTFPTATIPVSNGYSAHS